MEIIITKMEIQPSAEGMSDDNLNVCVIDGYKFTQDCLVRTLDGLHPRLSTRTYSNPAMLMDDTGAKLDLIIYYCHAGHASDTELLQDVAAICRSHPTTPLVVLSDADDAQQVKIFHNMLKVGAHGFIPTQTTGIPVALAAFRLIKEGGTFAPKNLAMANQIEHTRRRAASDYSHVLTAREMAVLRLLRRGIANKVIAHELNMSESTVKVHVRNIMRKVGATNRTQAVFKAQQLLDGEGPA